MLEIPLFDGISTYKQLNLADTVKVQSNQLQNIFLEVENKILRGTQ